MQTRSSTIPKDAIVLFDGKDFSYWTGEDENPVGWRIVDGAMEVVPGSGSIVTKRKFKDFKLHVEFNIPRLHTAAKGQHRANSGVYLQCRYEVQILDSFGQEPRYNGCGAIYRVKAPDENASKKAGEWQTYDIIFHAPRFDRDYQNIRKVENARITVIHNGVLIHNAVEIPSKTGRGQPEGPEPGPILLQDHGSKVKFRNIWLIPLDDTA
ncbi:MAG: DUF1080 domain-containing protein [Planctomycetota bacterium]|nr:MAG: DUF1080 domain-containing protein [Planctomycetota bacterium]